ncbi:MAG: hypothetical protein ACLU9X_07325 [Alistipes shahii]
MSIPSCCRSSGSRTSTCCATTSASTSKRRPPSPTTSRPPTRTSRPRPAGLRRLEGRLSTSRRARDNRWGYGLAGGGGIAFLIRRFELNFRVRYSFGYSDIVRNRNKYYDNNSDGAENPFWATPLRSPLDNLMISVGLNYRFNKQGFEAWKPRPKKEKNREVFKFGL